MNADQKKKLSGIAGGRASFKVPMSFYTTLGVGGPAEALYQPGDIQQLGEVIAYLGSETIPYVVVGRGSNLLVTDKGISGVVIILDGTLEELTEGPEGPESLVAGGGLGLVDLLLYCRKNGLGGLEFLSWVPGTVGGAVRMNAGAFGKEMSEYVREIQIIDPAGRGKTMNREDLSFSYRNLDIEQGAIITRVVLRLMSEDRSVIESRVKDFMKRRKQSQPFNYPSAGSVFKNPPGEYAGRLIERAGLKGRRVGEAMISGKHANFIVNIGRAKARDIIELMSIAREEVKKGTGIELEPEIRILGD